LRTAGEEKVVSATRASEADLPSVLTYHKIGRQFEIGITTVTRSRFCLHLDLLARAPVCVIKSALEPGVKGMRARVLLTFDDGYESVYTDAFPEMCSRGFVGTVFPVVGAVGGCNTWDVRLSPRPFRHLSWSQLCELVGHGFKIGSHTLSHVDLTKLDLRSLRRELRASKMLLEDRIGVPVEAIAYPFGRFSRRVIAEAAEAGYTCGYTSWPRRSPDPMAAGRMSVYAIDGAGALLRKLKLRPGYMMEFVKNRMIAGLSWGTAVVKG
jgi:peptidoglycan/xylan/chitin deacetylase (PgdA/CDA1 family)